MGTALSGHERIDQRSIALHRAIAEKIRRNPELIEIAHENIARGTGVAGRSQRYLNAWRTVLAQPLEEVLPRLSEDSEEMRAMRQATPFAGVLTAAERWAIYELYAMDSVKK